LPNPEYRNPSAIVQDDDIAHRHRAAGSRRRSPHVPASQSRRLQSRIDARSTLMTWHAGRSFRVRRTDVPHSLSPKQRRRQF
jgi:hypothetical protein